MTHDEEVKYLSDQYVWAWKHWVKAQEELGQKQIELRQAEKLLEEKGVKVKDYHDRLTIELHKFKMTDENTKIRRINLPLTTDDKSNSISE